MRGLDALDPCVELKLYAVFSYFRMKAFGNVEVYYWAGWVTLFAYLPLYWYRVYVEDKRNKPVAEASASL